MQIHQQTGVPMSSKDKSDYGKKLQANRRSGKISIFVILFITCFKFFFNKLLVAKSSKRSIKSTTKERASKKANIRVTEDDNKQ